MYTYTSFPAPHYSTRTISSIRKWLAGTLNEPIFKTSTVRIGDDKVTITNTPTKWWAWHLYYRGNQETSYRHIGIRGSLHDIVSSLRYPFCWQTTLCSSWLREPHTLVHKFLMHISTLPSMLLLPPTNVTSPLEHSATTRPSSMAVRNSNCWKLS